MELLKFMSARLREPSTWAGIATALALAHVNIDPGAWHQVTLWGGAAAAVLAGILSEVGKKPGAEIAADAMAAAVAAIKAMPDAGKAAAVLALAVGLSACAANTAGGNLETATLAAARVDPATASRIVVGANFGATLACRVGPQLLAVGNVQVKGASAAAVAAACAAIDPTAVPAPAPVGAVLPLVTAPPAVAAAVVASQAAQQALNGARS